MSSSPRRIRVLHLIKNFNLGGAETNLLNLVKAFDRDLLEIHVGYSSGGEIKERFVREGLTLFQYAAKDHKVASIATFGIILRLCGYLLKHRIDIVHTHNFNSHIWGLLAAKLTGKKVVEHVHDYRYLDTEDYARRHGTVDQFRFIRYFKRMSDRVVVLTSQNARYVRDHGFCHAANIREIRNGIPIEEPVIDRAQIRKKLSLPSDAKVILTPARLSEEKNIALILAIAADVKRSVPEALFVVAGDGPLKGDLQKEIGTRDLMNTVRMIGFYPDVRELLGIADVFLLPSFLELHSIAILEALSSKIPVVVSSDTGCNSDILQDGVNAFLRDPFQAQGWAKAVASLLKDEALSRKVGENGYRLCVEKFDIRVPAEAFERLYAELA